MSLREAYQRALWLNRDLEDIKNHITNLVIESKRLEKKMDSPKPNTARKARLKYVELEKDLKQMFEIRKHKEEILETQTAEAKQL